MSKPGPQGWEFHKDQVVYLVVEEKGEDEEPECVLREFKFKKRFRWQRPGTRYLVCEPPLGGYREVRNSRCATYKKAIHPEACTELLCRIGTTPEEAVNMYVRAELEKEVQRRREGNKRIKLLLSLMRRYPGFRGIPVSDDSLKAGG